MKKSSPRSHKKHRKTLLKKLKARYIKKEPYHPRKGEQQQEQNIEEEEDEKKND